MGALPPLSFTKVARFERNRALVLTPTKNIRPRAMGHLALGPSLRQHPCWLGRVFCLRFGALERSFCAHHTRQLHR